MARDKISLTRSITSELKTRNTDDNEKTIDGYFVVYNNETELWKGAKEEVNGEAFNNTLDNDIRALINHDTSLVLGRNKSGTLDLKSDSYGLWGSVKVNEKDQDAVNLYERVKRGDVNQCSFGFNIRDEEFIENQDGTIKWIIKDVDLHEVSVCTFPAYEDTSIQARHKDYNNIKERKLESRKAKLKERVRNVKTINSTKED
jgi:HK97 family phage prohead protease